MNKSSVTLITLDYPPNRGGIASYLGSIVKESDGKVSVIVPETQDTTCPGRVDTAVFFRKRWPRWFPLIQVCRRVPNQILISHIFPIGTAALVSKKFGGPDYSVIFHGLDVRMAKGIWKRWLAARIASGAKALIVNSEATRRELKVLIPNHDIVVVTPGVEDAEYLPRVDARNILGLDQDESVVLSVSRLVARKGLDFSIRAISKLQTRQSIKYIIIGDGTDYERLKSVASECRADVRWIRDADDETKRLWFSAADVFLLPARDEKFDVEGFGIVFLEAAKAGIPSVAGDSGGIPEAVRHERTGLLVNPNNIQEIAKAIERLLTDKELSRRLGMAAKERVEKEFQWKDRWGKLKNILQIE
jgi:phosphatidylinositol alpha-1,6-mannosyltransferase